MPNVTTICAGPPFTHPRRPYAAHFVGSSSPRGSPAHYIACIAALLQTYRLDVQYAAAELETGDTFDLEDDRSSMMVPLVVNTQGWIKGMGADLMRAIEEVVPATHIFVFEAEPFFDHSRSPNHKATTTSRSALNGVEIPSETNWVELGASDVLFQSGQTEPAKVYALTSPPAGPLSTTYTASDIRVMSLMSYFHHHASEGVSPSWRTSQSLLSTPPYEVDISVAFDAVILHGAGYEDVVYEELLRALNCSIVALVETDDSSWLAEDGEGTSLPIPYIQGRTPPDPRTSQCHGLAFIRGISTPTISQEHIRLHLLTPVSLDILARCRVLIKGEMEMPVWAFIGSSSDPVAGQEWRGTGAKSESGGGCVGGVPWEKVPYLAFRGVKGEAVAVGSGVKRPRKNVMRRGQM